MSIIRMGAGAVLLMLGLFVFATSTIGVFRFRYVLNRMHVAAQCDTLGSLCMLAGLSVLCGWSFHTLKLVLIIGFLWLASPLSSHIIAKAEMVTHPAVGEEYEVIEK